MSFICIDTPVSWQISNWWCLVSLWHIVLYMFLYFMILFIRNQESLNLTYTLKMYVGELYEVNWNSKHYKIIDKVFRQWYALGNGLQGILGIPSQEHKCGCYFDTYCIPNIVSYQVHPFMGKVFPNNSGLFQPENAFWNAFELSRNGLRDITGIQCGALASKLARSQSIQASMWCAGQTSPIHVVPYQLKRFYAGARYQWTLVRGHVQFIHCSSFIHSTRGT